MTTLAYRIRTARKDAHLTQVQLARASRVSQSAISQYEIGEVAEIGADTLLKMANALGVSPYWLLYGEPHSRTGMRERIPEPLATIYAQLQAAEQTRVTAFARALRDTQDLGDDVSLSQ